MQSGLLNKRIEIKAPTETRDQYGDSISTFETIRTCWANIKLNNKGEFHGNDQFTHVYTYLITVRYFTNTSFNETCIVRFDDADYEIETIQRERLYDEIILIVKKVN